MNGAPALILCDPDTAGRWCAASWARETEEHAALALSLVEQAHDACIGLTPVLAAGLARLLTNPLIAGEREGPWGPVLAALQRELAGPAVSPGAEKPVRATNASPGSAMGFVLATHPIYAWQRLALPLIEAAEQTEGASLLFAAYDDAAPSWSEEQCAAHEARLIQRIAALATSEAGAWKLFFRERALVMGTLARTRTGGAVMESDPGVAALLAGLVPELPAGRSRTHRSRTARFPLRKQVIRRAREAGFTGVYTTRDPDLRDMLTSELLNPTEVWLDRVLNTGYQAFEREPKREHLRHVLIVGVMPATLGAMADVVKAAWHEACLRLMPQLIEAGLSRSEFRLLDGGPARTWTVARFQVEDYPAAAIPAGEPTPGYRHIFLGRLGWLPHSAELSPIRGEVEAATPDEAWVGAVWREHQREAERAEGNTGLAAREYSYVHVLAALPSRPASADEPSGQRAARTLRRDHLRLPAEESSQASLAWIPTGNETEWRYAASFRSGEQAGTWDPSRSLAEKVGDLAAAWLTEWEEEIFHD